MGIVYERSTFDVHSSKKGGDEKSDNLNFRETKQEIRSVEVKEKCD